MAELLDALKSARVTGRGLVHTALGLVSPTGEPQKGYMWEVHIDVPYAVPLFAPKNIDAHYNKSLLYYAQAVTIPDTTVTLIEDKYLGQTFYHPGMQEGGKTTTVTFWDDQNLTVYKYLKNWINLINGGQEIDVAQRSVAKKLATRNVRIQLKDTTDFLVNLEITLVNTFCYGISSVEASYDSSDSIRVTAQLAFDVVLFGDSTQQSGDFPQASADVDSNI